MQHTPDTGACGSVAPNETKRHLSPTNMLRDELVGMNRCVRHAVLTFITRWESNTTSADLARVLR